MSHVKLETKIGKGSRCVLFLENPSCYRKIDYSIFLGKIPAISRKDISNPSRDVFVLKFCDFQFHSHVCRCSIQDFWRENETVTKTNSNKLKNSELGYFWHCFLNCPLFVQDSIGVIPILGQGRVKGTIFKPVTLKQIIQTVDRHRKHKAIAERLPLSRK